MIKIAIRIDDITCNMDWDRFNKMTAILDKHNICPLIGVIPDNKDEMLAGSINSDYNNWLQQRISKGWIVAMHGFNHKYVTKKAGCFPLNKFSEYAGLTYEEQFSKIKAGKQLLNDVGVETDIFMAPAHSFDKNTIKSLKQCGFKYVTDGFGDMPYERDNMTYLPISFRKAKDINKDNGYTTFVYHVWDMKESDFDSLDKLLTDRRGQFINYGELLEIKATKQKFTARISEKFKANLKRVLVKLRG